MGSIYAVNSEKSLMLYTYRSNIYFKTAVGERTNRPTLLAGDYQAYLSDVIQGDTLYYAYLDLQGHMVIGGVSDTLVRYRLPEETGEGTAPRLAAFSGGLILFYAVRNPVNDTYTLHAAFPLKEAQPIRLPGVYEKLPVFRPVSDNRGVFLAVSGNQETQIFYVNQNGNVISYQSGEMLEKLQTELESIRSRLREREAEYEKQRRQEEQHGETEAQLRRQLSEKTEEIGRQAALIESIKKQYNELMETAVQYREEARKWYRKLM